MMQMLSIFLKLQAVKQSGPGFLAYSVYILNAYFKYNVLEILHSTANMPTEWRGT